MRPRGESGTTFYDSVGQAPNMGRADEEVVVLFTMDRMEIALGDDRPFAGAIGLSGALSVSMPDQYPLVGFVLIVSGNLIKSLGSAAAVFCSLGHTTKSIEWPLGRPEGLTGLKSLGPDEPFPEGSFLDTGFNVSCFVDDTRPAEVGQPPFPQLPPLPTTISMQARRRFEDESVTLNVTGFQVMVVSRYWLPGSP